MKEYRPENYKPMPKRRVIAGICVGVAAAALSIYSHTWWGIAAGVLIVMSSLMSKKIYLDAEGIHMHYNARFYKYQTGWDYGEVEYIHREFGKAENRVMLHFSKGFVTRKFLFKLSDGEAIIEMAKKRNGKIIVDDAG